jgi:hypothetical protein
MKKAVILCVMMIVFVAVSVLYSIVKGKERLGYGALPRPRK